MERLEVVADRFHIEGVAGKGGMGTVFRARDVAMGGQSVIALKIVEGDFANERFEREATLLAKLQHPGIVRYIAHGETSDGRMYLAMEWLEGLSLDARLRAGALGYEEGLAIGRTIARALGAVHVMGIVHRDVKPSNVILRNGDAYDAVLVDFGIARSGKGTRGGGQMTATGAVIGTPAYMAPEQARAERTVDARADVFSLGCVLFECLCGRAPFVGEHVIAVLAKILSEPAPRLRSIRPEMPAPIDALLNSMLQKSPDGRPANGDAVAARLDVLSQPTPTSPSSGGGAGVRSDRAGEPSSAQRGESIGVMERRFATVLLARTRISDKADDGAAYDDPLSSASSTSSSDGLSGITEEAAIIDAASGVGMSIVPLANGMFVGSQVAADAGPDAAHRAARCALALRGRMPESVVAIATGRAIVADQVPVGDAIDRAARLLAESMSMSAVGIRIDEATASVVEARFELLRHTDPSHRITLVRERDHAERTIMGRVVPFVGREREIALLEATFRECIDEPVARATILLAPPGTGKTRLQRELVTRLLAIGSSSVASKKDEDDGDDAVAVVQPSVWIGLADPVMARAPLAFVGDVLRSVIGLAENEPLFGRRDKILKRVATMMKKSAGDDEVVRIATFLGEIAGAPFDDGNDSTLRAARQSPELLASQIDEAFIAFANAELQSRPLVFILEDVHWADAASLRLFSTLLSRSRDRPLMVLALGRPGLDDVHPKLWDELRCQRVVLEPLLRKASERLARAVLGDRSARTASKSNTDIAQEVEAIVQRAEGNALFVEELARACLEGRDLTDLPPTIAAATEARLATFDAETRHLLRAAAIFGERFWPSGVAKLLGRSSPSDAKEIEARIMSIEERELVSRAPDSRFAGEREYVFRHALVRDAAYAMLTDEDRRLGHALAAEWLEAFELGDEMADVLALHFGHAELWAKAATHARKAAERAIRLSRFSEGLVLLDRTRGWLQHANAAAAASGVIDENGGAAVHDKRQELTERTSRAALIDVLLEQERVCDMLSDRERQKVVLDELLSMLVRGRDDTKLAKVHARYGELLALGEKTEEAQQSLDLALELSRTTKDLAMERLARKGMGFLAWRQGRYADAVVHNERVVEIARALSEPYGQDLLNWGMSLIRAGEMERARSCLDAASNIRNESTHNKSHRLHFQAMFFAELGDVDAQIATYKEALALQHQNAFWNYKIITQDALAATLIKNGRIEEGVAAYAEVARIARMIDFKPQLARALQMQGDALVNLGRLTDALPLFAESVDAYLAFGDSSGALYAADCAARTSRQVGAAADASITQRHYERAIDVARQAGNQKKEGAFLNTLAILHFATGNYARAIEVYERALTLFESLGDRVNSTLLLNSIGAALQKLGQHEQARDRLSTSLRLARETGERLLEGHALALIGDAHREGGGGGSEQAIALAKESYEASLRIRRDLGDRRGEGWMLQKLALLSLAMRDADQAEILRKEAILCAESCGDKELAEACAKLL